MRTSEKVDQVLPAVVALQVGLTNPTKDAKGAERGGRKIPYLSLVALLDHIADKRREAGIAIAQEVDGDAGTVGVTTYLVHLSGQWVAFGPATFPAPNDPQQRGAVISYARRYALLAALGLAAEDDDGASAKVEPGPTSSSAISTQQHQGAGKAEAEGSGADVHGEGATAPDAEGEGHGEPAPAGPSGGPPPSAHPGKDHILKKSNQPNVPPSVRYCVIVGCDYTEGWP